MSARARHGLTMREIGALLHSQGNACRICGTTAFGYSGPVVDHDHALAASHPHPVTRGCRSCVRGMLCDPCNRGLGDFRDDPARMRRAAEYLEAWAARSA